LCTGHQATRSLQGARQPPPLARPKCCVACNAARKAPGALEPAVASCAVHAALPPSGVMYVYRLLALRATQQTSRCIHAKHRTAVHVSRGRACRCADARRFGLKYVYCWHGLPAYWAGVMPDAPEVRRRAALSTCWQCSAQECADSELSLQSGLLVGVRWRLFDRVGKSGNKSVLSTAVRWLSPEIVAGHAGRFALNSWLLLAIASACV